MLCGSDGGGTPLLQSPHHPRWPTSIGVNSLCCACTSRLMTSRGCGLLPGRILCGRSSTVSRACSRAVMPCRSGCGGSWCGRASAVRATGCWRGCFPGAVTSRISSHPPRAAAVNWPPASTPCWARRPPSCAATSRCSPLLRTGGGRCRIGRGRWPTANRRRCAGWAVPCTATTGGPSRRSGRRFVPRLMLTGPPVRVPFWRAAPTGCWRASLLFCAGVGRCWRPTIPSTARSAFMGEAWCCSPLSSAPAHPSPWPFLRLTGRRCWSTRSSTPRTG
ncbi:hypothetical protein SGRIM119S_03285 [Streptomyces griseorubiginosus]